MTSLSRSSFKPLVIRSYKILRKMSSSSSSCLNVEVKNEETAAPRSEWPWKKAKKAAVMLSFCGKKYLGMQRNPGFPTVEEELMKALKATGSIAPEWFENAQKAFFQRASRTDKGVSAARMIVSLKMVWESETINSLNRHLPSDIRVQDIKRVTKNFNSKSAAEARTYLYLLPTFAFSPVEDVLTPEKFRANDRILAQVEQVLKLFIGAHYFHNYTSGKLPMEPSSQRYITDFEMGRPFVKNDLEFAVIKVKGQSFMLHQIRKMIGMAIAVVRGHASESVIEQTWQNDRIDVPRAPGLGLMLDQIHYDKYNQRFGSDGIHDPLEWVEGEVADRVETFKEEMIFSDIIDVELKEKSMFEWMANLPIHTFEPRHFESSERKREPLGAAMRKMAANDNKNVSNDNEPVNDIDKNI